MTTRALLQVRIVALIMLISQYLRHVVTSLDFCALLSRFISTCTVVGWLIQYHKVKETNTGVNGKANDLEHSFKQRPKPLNPSNDLSGGRCALTKTKTKKSLSVKLKRCTLVKGQVKTIKINVSKFNTSSCRRSQKSIHQSIPSAINPHFPPQSQMYITLVFDSSSAPHTSSFFFFDYRRGIQMTLSLILQNCKENKSWQI